MSACRHIGSWRRLPAAWRWPAAPTIPIPTPTGTRRSSTPPSTSRRRRSTRRSPTRGRPRRSPATSTTRCSSTTTSSGPIELIPGLAEAVPEAEPLPDGRVAYRFRLRPGVALPGRPVLRARAERPPTREVVAADVAFALMRIGRPGGEQPGRRDVRQDRRASREFGKRLAELREADPAFAAQPLDEQYARGRRHRGRRRARRATSSRSCCAEPYPQLLYWFAMPFTAPVPWEAVAYYDGQDGRAPSPSIRRHRAVPARASTTSSTASCSSAIRTGTAPASGMATRPAPSIPREGEPGRRRRGRSMPPTSAGRCRSSIASSSGSTRRTSRASTSSCRATTTIGGIIQESFDRVVQERRGCRPRWRRAACASTRSVEPSHLLHRLQHGRPGRRARRPASAGASCARR